jgi:NAD(P)-dependent dehydrogenase (short-subunit alcohol dehydrogenase family)/rhamnose utilization protein RhaD (predicted bifunctional aldolase and dehydrogenase)
MKPGISELLEISRFYGGNKDYVIAGGGNTSYKDGSTIWIKASGQSLASLTEDGLVALDREKLRIISTATYSLNSSEREEQVKNDMHRSIHEADRHKRPSVETSLHEIINYKYVVHLHPTLINGMLCSRNAKNATLRLFGERVLFVPYIDPGYTLFKKLETDLIAYRNKFQTDPQIIFLENHGSFAAADSTEEIKKIYNDIHAKISENIFPLHEITPLPWNPEADSIIPFIRMHLSGNKPLVVRSRHNSLIAQFYQSQQEYHKISIPLTPDVIVYCKTRFMYIEKTTTVTAAIESFKYQLPNFVNEYGYQPRIIVMKGMGIFAFAESVTAAESSLDVYEDMVKISYYASLWGGLKYLTPEQVSFIDKWEVENYRRKVAASGDDESTLMNKVAIVTGGAQGFGAGIAESLYKLRMNVIVADVNEAVGNAFVSKLSSTKSPNRAIFVQSDVSDAESVKNLVSSAVREFGGLDIMISNAGILRAGGLDEMDPETFSKSTDVNYKGYFLCAKYASVVMKMQNQGRPEYFSDIIQINSKSGLKGSNKNFAYAGAKFGGIGLTQSFALELAPYRIKVNSVCPGNFYDGPLWSDPQNGLFVQYLKTGKVPGARTIDDVRKFYEDQVPLRRGCRLEDVVKAILYVISQEYETGQAIPVTGGQVMLG